MTDIEPDEIVTWLRQDPRLHSDKLRDEMAEELEVTRAQLDEAIEEDARAWKMGDPDLVYVYGLDLGPALFDDDGQPITRRTMPPPADS